MRSTYEFPFTEHDNALHGVHGHHDIKARLAEAEICVPAGARLTPFA